ncbi:transmembrane and death domain protein 1 [Mixophyes fleayi]|uniref:transmembrane and death domain protein 1 n=1 Tax=Mixophyes fleayi TaxID=3061075 RepID=UPI003F4DE2D2
MCMGTAADDIGPHMISRISDLLTPEECQDFYVRITGPEEGPEDENTELIRALSPKFGQKKRRRRDIVDREQCKRTLQNWLETQGDTVYWDDIFAILFKVGRSDVAVELGKNLNQDKVLEIEKNIDDYHKSLENLKSPLLAPEEDKFEGNVRYVRDLSRLRDEDWDLVIERQLLPPYDRSLTEWCWPILYGIIIGFIGTAILVGLIVQIIVWVTGFSHAGCIIKIQDFPADKYIDKKYPAYKYKRLDEDADIEKNMDE